MRSGCFVIVKDSLEGNRHRFPSDTVGKNRSDSGISVDKERFNKVQSCLISIFPIVFRRMKRNWLI